MKRLGTIEPDGKNSYDEHYRTWLTYLSQELMEVPD